MIYGGFDYKDDCFPECDAVLLVVYISTAGKINCVFILTCQECRTHILTQRIPCHFPHKSPYRNVGPLGVSALIVPKRRLLRAISGIDCQLAWAFLARND